MLNHLPEVALVKSCSEKFHKFHKKEPLMNSFLSSVVAWDFTEKELHHFLTALNPRAFSGMLLDGGEQKTPLPKICHTYRAMMKLGTAIPYLRKIQKVYESHETPFQLCWYQHVFTVKQQILLY